MQDNNKTQIAKDWILKLANGINPLDGSAIKDDDIVNNVHISRCLFYVAELINPVSRKKEKKANKYDIPFNLTAEDLSRILITEKSGIAYFTREINKVIPSNMKPLASSKIVKWLVANGYLQEVPKEDGGKTKHPTAEGNKIGITTEMKKGVSGYYLAVEYDSNAQRFILNNIYAIFES